MAERAARQRLVSAFVSAGATTPDAASPSWPTPRRGGPFAGWSDAAIVEAAPGRYWLDPERLDGFRSVVRRRVEAWVAAVGIAAIVVATAAAVSLAE